MIEKINLDKTNAWPFVEAKKILREKKISIEKKGKITLQTGYGPSGLPHIGTFSEVARTSMIVNALNHLTDIPKSHDLLQQAREYLNKATKLDPSFLNAHTNKGYNSYLQCEYDLAEEELDLAMDLAEQDNIEASNAYVYLYMGILYTKLEKYNKSIHYFQLALDIYLKHDYRKEIAAVLHNMGLAILNSGNPEEALDCYNRSIRIKEEKSFNSSLLKAEKLLKEKTNNTCKIQFRHKTSLMG